VPNGASLALLVSNQNAEGAGLLLFLRIDAAHLSFPLLCDSGFRTGVRS
jgi:hypothetical protein